MNTKPLLSICIPTYNQPEEVKRLLSNIATQIKPDVEVIMWDDSSNDITQDVVIGYKQKFPIRYFRGVKEGIDKPIISLTQEARGEYVWWMGDEELLEGAIERVLCLLREHPDITFIWVNHRISSTGTLAVDIGQDRFFKNREEMLERVVGGLGFISSCIFRREIALSGIESAKRYIGTLFVNLYIVLHVLSSDGQAYFLNGPYLVSHLAPPEKSNPNGFEVFGVHFFNIVSEFKGKFAKGAIRRMLKRNFGCVWRGMLVRWVTGYESPRPMRLQMLRLYWSYPACWIALMLFSLPLWLNKLLYRLYRVLFRYRKFRFRG